MLNPRYFKAFNVLFSPLERKVLAAAFNAVLAILPLTPLTCTLELGFVGTTPICKLLLLQNMNSYFQAYTYAF